MNKNKKIILGAGSLLGIVAPVSAVISCNNGGGDKLDVQPLYEGSKKAADLNKTLNGKKIGFVNYNGSDTFMQTVQAGITGNSFGGTVQIADATNDQAVQNQRIDTHITNGVNGLNINLVEPASAVDVINKAKTADIPIVLVNKEAPESNRKAIMNSYSKLVYVGSDPFESGRMQAKLIYDDLVAGIIKDRDGDNKIDYVVLGGQKGHADAIARSQAVRSELYKLIKDSGVNASNISTTGNNVSVDGTTKAFSIKKGLTESQIKGLFEDHSAEELATFVSSTGEQDWSISGGKKVVEGLLSNNIKLDFISGNNDDTALGGYAALEAKNAKPQTDMTAFAANGPAAQWLPVYGVDANAGAIASIKAGKLSGTVKQDGPGIGKASNAALAAMILNLDIDAYFTKQNISITKDSDFANNRAYRVPYVAISRDEAKQIQ